MRYVIVSVIKGEAGDFNNKLRKEVFSRFGASSSKLPAHFTIKAPFEYDGDISSLEKSVRNFVEMQKPSPLLFEGFGKFNDRVIYMKVDVSKEGKEVHDRFIDVLSEFDYINFDKKDGKDKVFHVTISSKKLQPVFNKVWEYVNALECRFESYFDNICIYKWLDNTWKLHCEYLLKGR